MSESSKYVKLSQIDHVKTRPDTYIGSTTPVKNLHLVFDEEKQMIVKKEILVPPGLMKCVDEILSNARDRLVEKNLKNTCTVIKVSVSSEKNVITVYNNGDGIPAVKHDEYDIYIPELIFGNLLTSSNYDDSESRIAGGRNGLGAKLTNIFSKEFFVETVDHTRNLLYTQTFGDNLEKKSAPVICRFTKKPYTQISFSLDLERFGMTEITGDIVQLIKKRVYDIAATVPSFCKKTSVYFQDVLIATNTFERYMGLFYDFDNRFYETVNDRWKVGVLFVPHCGFEQISYVNSVNTPSGGTHVNYVVDQITKHITNILKSKHNIAQIKPSHVKEHLVVFIDALITNPSFNTQTKEELTTPVKQMGSSCVLSPKFLDKISKSGIIDMVMDVYKFKEKSLIIKKSDGKKVSKIKGLPKLEDAEYAGTDKSRDCMLILTEGDSAKASAMAGLSVIGRKFFGIFPLKGKLLNVRDSSTSQILKNEEIQNIKKIMGLKNGETYATTDELRYGKGIVIFTDQDVDGSHIKGLLMNFIHFFWPNLLSNHRFITCLTTPIIKVSKGLQNRVFYNMTNYHAWKTTLTNQEIKAWSVKYYKGLGTSTAREAKEYFVDFGKKLVYYNADSKTDESFDLAFLKTRSHDRKSWLQNYDHNIVIENSEKEISYSDFINKELIHFSNDDNKRSLPNVVDGLKPSQRKILFGSFLRRLDKDEVKVSQLSGFVSDKACYHHGEASLNNAIVGMASTFVGSNNIEWLVPNGQFGTRLKGGKDAASPRYIWTSISPLVSQIVKKEDNCILEFNDDDGIQVEPSTYLPILPMVLVNGCEGIGTGFSTYVPSFNPLDLIDLLITRIKSGSCDASKLVPYYRGFKGSVQKNPDDSFLILGNYSVRRPNHVIITELPVGTWTSSYKEFLLDLIDKKEIEDFTENNTDSDVYFDIRVKEIPDDLVSKLRLGRTIRCTNMHLFTPEFPERRNSHIKKYESIDSIINDFYEVRAKGYEMRKTFILKSLSEEIRILKNKVLFIDKIVSGEIKIQNISYRDLISLLEEKGFFRGSDNFEYLTNMKLFSLTKEKKEELEKFTALKEEQYADICEKDPSSMWIEELEKLRAAL